jgi:hypothetical protein
MEREFYTLPAPGVRTAVRRQLARAAPSCLLAPRYGRRRTPTRPRRRWRQGSPSHLDYCSHCPHKLLGKPARTPWPVSATRSPRGMQRGACQSEGRASILPRPRPARTTSPPAFRVVKPSMCHPLLRILPPPAPLVQYHRSRS